MSMIRPRFSNERGGGGGGHPEPPSSHSVKVCIYYKVFMCILNSFTEADILYFGCMEFKILFDFHK